MLPSLQPTAEQQDRNPSHFTGTTKQSPAIAWEVDPGKVLEAWEVWLVLRSALRRKDEAIRRRARTAVRDWFVAELMLGSGLRVSEAAALRCDDLLLGERSFVRVRRGKGGRSRVVAVGKRLREAAASFLEWKRLVGEPMEPGQPLLRSTTTRKALTARALQQSWRRTLQGAGVRHVGIHGARHTYATHLLQSSGGNLRLVQRQLGHASVATTQIYLGLFSAVLEEAVEGLYALQRQAENLTTPEEKR